MKRRTGSLVNGEGDEEISLADRLNPSGCEGSVEKVRRPHLTGQTIGLQHRTKSAVPTTPSIVALHAEVLSDVAVVWW